MLKKMFLLPVFVLILASVPAFAAKTGCQKFNFLGAYTRVDPPTDVFGDGSVIHQYVYQLSLTADGSVRQAWTGTPDYQINTGTGSDLIGSWVCRPDGKLVVSTIFASYFPTTVTPNTPKPDVRLVRHFRSTTLYDVPDADTLVRIQSRSRSYLPTEDPTNTSGGTLGAINNTSITYNRFVASDADLLLP